MNNNYKPSIKELESPLLGARCFRMGSCHILLAKESFFKDRNKLGWHLSISHPKRYPTWDEITRARYELLPDNITMVQMLPPKSEYINIHKNCFHLWELEEGTIIP